MTIRIKTLFLILATILGFSAFQACQKEENEIEMAVKAQLEKYPGSSLKDIYKSFFQDEFGPGHLLNDAAGAWQYLEYELSEMTSSGNYNAEPCGTGKNFYRVPLDLVKDGIISDSILFNAFMESASSFRLPDIDSWKKKWEKIEDVVEKMNLNLPEYKEDKESLADMLSQGETAIHHSNRYEELYHPHYRIVGRKQWEMIRGKYLQ
jgi:hypothetical protein